MKVNVRVKDIFLSCYCSIAVHWVLRSSCHKINRINAFIKEHIHNSTWENTCVATFLALSTSWNDYEWYSMLLQHPLSRCESIVLDVTARPLLKYRFNVGVLMSAFSNLSILINVVQILVSNQIWNIFFFSSATSMFHLSIYSICMYVHHITINWSRHGDVIAVSCVNSFSENQRHTANTNICVPWTKYRLCLFGYDASYLFTTDGCAVHVVSS